MFVGMVEVSSSPRSVVPASKEAEAEAEGSLLCLPLLLAETNVKQDDDDLDDKNNRSEETCDPHFGKL